MSLPRSRNQTYAALTQLTSKDVNDIQDAIVRHERLIAGPDLVVIDDFMGSAIDTHKWIVTGAVTIANGVSNSARGIVTLAVNGVNTSMDLSSPHMVIGGNNLGFCAGVAASMSGAGGMLSVGLIDYSGGGYSYFFWTNYATGTWQVNFPGGIGSADTGVAFSTTIPDKLECIRQSGTLTFYINDVIVHQQSDASNQSECYFTISANRTTSNLTLICDYFKYWAGR